MSEEDIKKLSEAFAEQEYNEVLPYLHNPSPKEKDEFVRKASGDIRKAFQWLADRYCLVEKSKIAEWEIIVENALKADHAITEPAWRFLWERLFGKEMFEG